MRKVFAAVAAVGVAMAALLSLDLIGYRHQAIDKARTVSDNLSRLLSERIDGSVREVDYVLRGLADDASSIKHAKLEAKRATLPNASVLAVFDPWENATASIPSAPAWGPSSPTAPSRRRPRPSSTSRAATASSSARGPYATARAASSRSSRRVSTYPSSGPNSPTST
jgi:hypothetical protein